MLEQRQEIKKLILDIIIEHLRDLKATSKNVGKAKEKANLIQTLVEIQSKL